jgi:cysteine desulfuration protein SufE
MNDTLPISRIEAEIIDEFSLLDDWMDRYAFLIEMGRALPDLDDTFKQEAFRVKGCQSNVWLRAWTDDGLVFFEADSDAMITKGLIALLVRVFSGQPAKAIVDADLSFIDAIGLRKHLSPNRSNGLTAMITKMKGHATALGGASLTETS